MELEYTKHKDMQIMANKRLSYHRGTTHQRHIILEFKWI